MDNRRNKVIAYVATLDELSKEQEQVIRKIETFFAPRSHVDIWSLIRKLHNLNKQYDQIVDRIYANNYNIESAVRLVRNSSI